MFQLLDFGDGNRLEQWGDYRLIRPDPVALLGIPQQPELWPKADARYEGEKGKGEWMTYREMPERWEVDFDNLKLWVKLSPYKHTGVFPEQQENWRWARACAQTLGRPLTVLNLFAYTGGITMALAKDGHFVTHVDSSKPAITWAKDNALLNDIPGDRIRWMLEDAAVFAAKEKKRGKRYDAIVLDPPAYGHSPTGKTWRVERDLAPLLEDCVGLLSDSPAFLLLNGYAHGDTPESYHRLLTGIVRTHLPNRHVTIDSDELILTTPDGRELSTGVAARCTF